APRFGEFRRLADYPPWQVFAGRARSPASAMTWRTSMIRSAQPERSTQEIIRTGTRLRPVPLAPEIQLHQASDPIGLWQRTELAAGGRRRGPAVLGVCLGRRPGAGPLPA